MGCVCTAARHAVSLKKKRVIDSNVPNGPVDLDLTHVHKNIVCMGLPALGLESCYRNSYHDTLRYLDFKYGDDYMVYNLCGEKEHRYGTSLFHGRVREYPFPDHWACPLSMVPVFVQDAMTYINGGCLADKRVVVIHCKAGKGRTGLLTCCLLLKLEPSLNASAAGAIEYFGQQRTSDGRGLTIPSQLRYVHYYETLMKQFNAQLPSDVPSIDIHTFQLRGIHLNVNISSCRWRVEGKSCEFSLTSSLSDNVSIVKTSKDIMTVDVSCHSFFKGISHDVRLELFDGRKIVAALMFHTLFIQPEYNYRDIDRLCKRKLPEDADILIQYTEAKLCS